MPKPTIPVLLRGFLDAESLDQAWAEIDRAAARTREEVEILLVINSREADIRPTFEFVQRLATLHAPTAAKIYAADGPAALIALTAQRRQIMARGLFAIQLDPVEIEACEFDDAGVLKPEAHRLLKGYIHDVYASVRRLEGFSESLVCKLNAQGRLQLSPAECLANAVVERIIY